MAPAGAWSTAGQLLEDTGLPEALAAMEIARETLQAHLWLQQHTGGHTGGTLYAGGDLRPQ